MLNLYTFSSRYLLALLGVVTGVIFLAVLERVFLTMGEPSRNDALWAGTVRLLKEKNAASVSDRRVLLYGGSEVHFGYSARKVGEALGVHAFNMGTHAGNGLGMILSDAIRNARSGDSVVISIVPDHILVPEFVVTKNANIIDHWLGNHYFNSASWPEKLRLLSFSNPAAFFLSLLDNPVRRDIGYWLLRPDTYGDIPEVSPTDPMFSRALAAYRRSEPKFHLLERTERYFLAPALLKQISLNKGHSLSDSLIKRAVSAIERKGAKVYFTLAPSIYYYSNSMNDKLRVLVGEKRFISYQSPAFPVEAVHDTPFHANAEGRVISTAKLISGLCDHIACPSAGKEGVLSELNLIDSFSVVMNEQNLGAISEYSDGKESMMVRRAYGPKSSFEVVVPEDCSATIELSASVETTDNILTVYLNEEEVVVTRLKRDEFTGLSLPMPSYGKYLITLELNGDQAVGVPKSAIVLNKIRKKMSC